MTKKKDERFIAIAARRTQDVLRTLKSLQRCSNKNNYEYTPAQVRKMLSAISKEFEETKRVFTASDSANNKFQF